MPRHKIFLPLALLSGGLLALLLATCGRPVYYGHAARHDAAFISPQPVRLYLDRQGSLYPAAQDSIPVDDEQLAATGAYLLDYFTREVPANSARAATWQHLSAAYGLPAARINDSRAARADSLRLIAWRTLQQQMRQRFIKSFNAHLAATRPAMLVVLVHGFNNDVHEATWYAAVEDTLRQRMPNKAIQFLEIRWDGGTSKSNFGIWGFAQASMYPVGLVLRQVLAGIEQHELPVRIMAHSTGCPLTCIALWNSTSTLGKASNDVDIWGEGYRALCRQPAFTTPQFTNLQVAMLAPAMPHNHFTNYYERTPVSSIIRYKRIVFGYNVHDQATGKWILPAGLNFTGNTRLGVHPEDYCEYVLPAVLSRSALAPQIYQFDFTSGMKQAGTRGAHGVEQLMQDKATFNALLTAWLTDAVPSPAVAGLRTCP